MENRLVSKQFITALKQAEGIAFHLEGDICQISCSKKYTGNTDIFQGDGGQLRADFENFYGKVIGGKKAYFSDICRTKNEGAIAVLALIIREGDELHFYAEDNGNNYLEKAEIKATSFSNPCYHTDYTGIHNDELYCTIRRKDKTIIQRFTLLHCLCPNNSARSIQ